MTNVLHISKYYLPFRGGLEEVVTSLAEGAFQKGHHARVLCAAHESSLDSREEINGVDVFRYKTLAKVASQPICLAYLTKLREHLQWADIVYLHTPNPLAEFACLLLKNKTNQVFILHHSDIIKQKILRKVYRPLQNLVYSSAKRIIVATENHIRYSTICSHYSEKCSTIPFGLRARSTKITRKNAAPNFALFVGRLVEYKGISIALSAMSQVRGKLVIVGEGPLEAELKGLSNKIGVEDKVDFLGRVSDERIDELLSECLFLVLPSISAAENFGLVQVEAMMHAKAVISSKLLSGASTVVEDNITGLQVEPGNSDELAQKMNYLFENPEIAHEMGRKGHERFKTNYSYEVMVDRHEQLISESFGESKC